MSDEFSLKRAQMRDEFFAKLFLLGGWIGGTDTYKRTMWTAVPEIAARTRPCYSLTFRKGLARSRVRTTGSSWPATRRCSPSGFIDR